MVQYYLVYSKKPDYRIAYCGLTSIVSERQVISCFNDLLKLFIKSDPDDKYTRHLETKIIYKREHRSQFPCDTTDGMKLLGLIEKVGLKHFRIKAFGDEIDLEEAINKYNSRYRYDDQFEYLTPEYDSGYLIGDINQYIKTCYYYTTVYCLNEGFGVLTCGIPVF